MRLIILAPPAAEPITLAEAKAHLRVDHPAEEALIGALLKAAREQIESATGFALAPRRVLETRARWRLDPRGGQPLALRPATMLHAARVRANGAASPLAASLVALDPADAGRLVFPLGPPFTADGVEIEYTAGPSELPAALRQAVLVTAAALYEDRVGAEALPEAARALMAPFARARL